LGGLYSLKIACGVVCVSGPCGNDHVVVLLRVYLWLTFHSPFFISIFLLPACRLARPRGVLSSDAPSYSTFYEIDDGDARIKAEFTMINEHVDPQIMLVAYVLIGSGASSELTLPAKKAIDLRLRKLDGVVKTTGSTNNHGIKLRFHPVLVKARFTRADGSVDTRESYLEVTVHQDDYDAEIARREASSAADGATKEISVAPPADTGASAFVVTPDCEVAHKSTHDDVLHTTLPSGPPIKDVIKLSPVEHRPTTNKHQRVVMGARGLQKLGLHSNHEQRCLEIEEEYIVEED
jgi:hypothetical protein